MKRIPVVNYKRKMIVDDEDYLRFAIRTWYASDNGNGVNRIVTHDLNHRKVSASRFALNEYNPEVEIDHINGNLWDQRKENLRKSEHKENLRNRSARRNGHSCEAKGVTYRESNLTSPYIAQITVNSENVYLGSFATEKAAAKAYNEAAKKYFGEFAKLNDI